MTDGNCPALVIVLGPPGSGKTTLARRIAREFRMPLIAKDDIKESLFETLGSQDRAWSQKLGRATFELLYYFVETQIAVGRSLIAECNFDNEHATPRFHALQNKFDFEPFQILCDAPDEILVQRFRTRWESGKRHRGHVDEQIAPEEFTNILKHYQAPLDIGGKVIKIDTTNFEQVNYIELFRELAQALNRTEARSE